MAAHNVALTAAMSARGIPVMDLFGFFGSDRFDSAARMITVGGETFSVDSIAVITDLLPAGNPVATGPCRLLGPDLFCSTPAYNRNYLVDDGNHLSTIINGLMANEFVAAIRRAFGFRVAALSDQEILSSAGI